MGSLEGWIKIDGWVLIQGDQRQIVGLIGHTPVEPAVLNDDIRGNVALPCLFPLQLSGGPADLAGLLRWILELAANGAVLQNQPLSLTASQNGWLNASGTGITFGIVSLHAQCCM